MATWIYNNEILRKHPIYKFCASYLSDVSNRDYPNKRYFNNKTKIECLDMDAYEKNVQKSSSPDCTTDAVIGICDFDNQEFRNARLLCVELRMDYESTRTFSKTDFERKVSHTKSILGYEKINIEKISLFVFSDRLEAQARGWFSRISHEGGILKYIKPCGVSQFSQIVMSKEDFPYKPQHDEQKIRDKFEILYNNKEWDVFMDEFNSLCFEANNYYGYLYKEYEFLRNLLTDIWSDFRHKQPIFDNEDIEFHALNIEDDFKVFLNI